MTKSSVLTDIPRARAILEEALDTCMNVDGLRISMRMALSHMTRTVSPKRPTGNVPMTAELGHEARRLHRETNLPIAEIGRRLKVDGGRVSEALNGMWY